MDALNEFLDPFFQDVILEFLNDPPSSTLLTAPVAFILLLCGVFMIHEQHLSGGPRLPVLIPFAGTLAVGLIYFMPGSALTGIMSLLLLAAAWGCVLLALGRPGQLIALAFMGVSAAWTFLADTLIDQPNWTAFGWLALAISSGIFFWLVILHRMHTKEGEVLSTTLRGTLRGRPS
ncbi:MAG: hypothetical protein K0S68_712 [Candidatus Saccharibacteria bacterium]|nr:hypothetical protein [Candidatus Saccharibacteria bacterium]